MATSNALTSFFEENFKNHFDFFLLYKDKQLLKEEKYVEFAQAQIKKTRNILLSVGFGLIYGMYFGVTTLISYGKTGEILELSLGVFAICFMGIAIFSATKEYYSIKSSMTLFLKLVEEEGV